MFIYLVKDTLFTGPNTGFEFGQHMYQIFGVSQMSKNIADR